MIIPARTGDGDIKEIKVNKNYFIGLANAVLQAAMKDFKGNEKFILDLLRLLLVEIKGI